MSVDELNEFKPNELGSRAEPQVCQFFSREGSGKFEMNQGMRALSKDRFYPEAGRDGTAVPGDARQRPDRRRSDGRSVRSDRGLTAAGHAALRIWAGGHSASTWCICTCT